MSTLEQRCIRRVAQSCRFKAEALGDQAWCGSAGRRSPWTVGDFDLSLLGITDEDLDALLPDPDQVEGGAVEGEDDIPEPPVTPVSVAGDLWHLGSHRLLCGDSTSADVVGRLLGDVKPLLMVTDPPYGVEYDPSWRNQAGAAKTKRTGKVLNDDIRAMRDLMLIAFHRSRAD